MIPHTLDYARRPGGARRRRVLWLVLAVVVAGVAAVWLFNLWAQRRQLNLARRAAAKADVEVLAVTLEVFKADAGRYPTTAEGLAALVQAPGGIKGWVGPYLRPGKVPTDPWSTPYAYTATPTGFVVTSAGPDGKAGTGDDVSAKKGGGE